MRSDRIDHLTEKFFNGTCSDEERKELAKWIKENPDEELAEVLEHAWNRFEYEEKMPDHVSERIIDSIFPEQTEVDVDIDFGDHETESTRYLWTKIAAAAVLILAVGIYWWSGLRQHSGVEGQNIQAVSQADIAPGQNKAVLTLGDGSSIVLDGAGSGTLAEQGNTSVTKSGKGELVYKSNNLASATPVYNTVSTPKGGQYHIVLPDGTKVWLNAASSLRFPTSFIGKERRVETSGEVYFEVAHNAKMPFIVKVDAAEVSVLGTHFNIMAYPDEKVMKTTLLEGSVKVTKSGREALLAPGQQARLTNSSDNIRILNDIDTDKEMAWKNGYFQFEDENLEGIMRQVSRWYDVEVTYEGNVSREHFTGRLPRNANVSKVLKILSLSGVKFRIEGKSIIVTP